jgi:hypothetical protein
MKFKIFKSLAEKRKKYEWHPYFAWRPINIDGCIVWLERIWRKKISDWGDTITTYSYEDPRPAEEAKNKAFAELLSKPARKAPPSKKSNDTKTSV